MKEQSIILPIEGADFRKRRLGTLGLFFLNLAVDKGWEVVIKPLRLTRSNAQNRALFGLAYEILSEHTGYTKEELHEVFCRAHFGEIEREIMGKIVTRPRRTTTTNENGKRSLLSTTAFAEFFDFVQRKGAEIGCFVPDPDPEYWRQSMDRAA